MRILSHLKGIRHVCTLTYYSRYRPNSFPCAALCSGSQYCEKSSIRIETCRSKSSALKTEVKMGLVTLLVKPLVKLVIFTAIFVAVVLLLPGIPPDIPFESYSVTPASELEGALKENNKLEKAEPVIDGGIVGAEAIVVLNDGSVITGVGGGDIIKLKDGKITVIAKIGKSCDKGVRKNACGRPLGLRLDASGNNLFVADAYYGLLRVNLKTGKVESLFPYEEAIDGRAPKLADDLDVSKDGTIYWSDASQHSIHDLIVDFLGNTGNGRLIKFDPKTKKNTVLVSGIFFANGVQLSDNEDFVLVCESMKSRVLRHYLKGPKRGQTDVFVDGLPGIPDNIRSNGKGGFYVNLVAERTPELELSRGQPLVRKFLVRLRTILMLIASLLDPFIGDTVFIDEVKEYVSSLGPVGQPSGKSIVVELSASGDIIASFHSPSKKVNGISHFQVSPKGDYAYLGSPFTDKLWKVKMSDLR